MKLVGIMEHAKPNIVSLLKMTEEHETGANYFIESVHRFPTVKKKRESLPRLLSIQLDNCTRENKNRYFMAYVEYLLGKRLFDHVEVSFLPIGRTHEDIDQLFSRTSERLRSKNAITLKDMQSELYSVYNDNTTLRHMGKISNWSGLCLQERCLTRMTNFSKNRYFLFVQANSTVGEVTECHVKVCCRDHGSTSEWKEQKIEASSSFCLAFAALHRLT